MKRSKRFKQIDELVENNKRYSLNEAVDLVKKTATAKFDENIDVSIKLGIDPKHSDQMVRGNVTLPHGTGKSVKIAVIVKGEKEKEARDAGADIVGFSDVMEDIQNNKINFDVLVTTPEMMKDLSKLGKILGPRGLMPNPKAGTVTFEIGKAVKELKKGKVEFRADGGGVVHLGVGKKTFTEQNLLENLVIFFEAIFKAKPASVKGQYLLNAYISASMGPGITLNTVEIINSYSR